MKGILLLNGEPYSGKIDDRGALVYCCDGAYKWAHGKVRIDKNIGDFDSLDVLPDPAPEEIYPSEKDYTDGEIAIFKLLGEGADEIEIYGGGGGRIDHFLGNLQLLYLAFKRGAKCVLLTDNEIVFVAEGKIPFGGYTGKTLSVLPFCGELRIMDYKGLKYPYPPALHAGECRGISNIVQSKDAFVEADGVALIIVNKGEV